MSREDIEISAGIEPLPRQAGRGPVGKGITAGVTSIVAASFPAATPLIVGLSASLQAVGDQLEKHQEVRLSELLNSAGAECGLTPEGVVRQLAEDEDLCLLAAEAFDAARRTRLPHKAAALGASLGSILTDATLIDLEAVWIRIISILPISTIQCIHILFIACNYTYRYSSTYHLAIRS